MSTTQKSSIRRHIYLYEELGISIFSPMNQLRRDNIAARVDDTIRANLYATMLASRLQNVPPAIAAAMNYRPTF